MLNQYQDFDVKHFMKTFYGNFGYDGRLNGYDVMIMAKSQKEEELEKNRKDDE